MGIETALSFTQLIIKRWSGKRKNRRRRRRRRGGADGSGDVDVDDETYGQMSLWPTHLSGAPVGRGDSPPDPLPAIALRMVTGPGSSNGGGGG